MVREEVQSEGWWNRDNALLTKKLRKVLLGVDEYEDQSRVRRFRQQVRSRLRDTLLDFSLLGAAAPQSLIEPAFDTDDTELREGIESALGVVYASVGDQEEFERLLTGGIAKVAESEYILQNNSVLVDVDISVSATEIPLEDLNHLYRNGELADEIEDVRDYVKVIESLWIADYISEEEAREAIDTHVSD